MATYGSRERILEIAERELGETDEEVYWAQVLDGPHPAGVWCAAFVLAVLREAGVTNRTFILGKGFLLSNQPGTHENFPFTRNPQPGDIAYFELPFQHHAIVEWVDGDKVHLIAGNTGTHNVARQTKNVADAMFFSVEPFVVPNKGLGSSLVGVAAAAVGLAIASWIYWKK